MSNDTQTKTVREWLQELPDGYRERALAQCHRPSWRCGSIGDALESFAAWAYTKEGPDFWCDVAVWLDEGGELPPLPEDNA
jgi:hypothetical protein